MALYRITKVYCRHLFCDVEADSPEEALKASVEDDVEWDWDGDGRDSYDYTGAFWRSIIKDEDGRVDDCEDEGDFTREQTDSVDGFYYLR